MIIHPYKCGSQSVRNLKEEMESRGEHTVVLHRKPLRQGARVVCWGARGMDYNLHGIRLVLNRPEVTRVFCNKLSFFKACGDSPFVPAWTTDKKVANGWDTVVCRHKLAGMAGEGIEIIPPSEGAGERKLPSAPLYVRYEKKTDEFRIHVFKGKDGVFRIGHHQKKVARDKAEVKDWQVRNTENGFFFQQHGYEVPNAVADASVGLCRDIFPEVDFIALDVIYHRPTDRAYILEGNTAPGLEGTSVQKYCDFFQERIGD